MNNLRSEGKFRQNPETWTLKTWNNYLLFVGRVGVGRYTLYVNPSADDILTGSPTRFCADNVFEGMADSLDKGIEMVIRKYQEVA